MDIEKQGSQAKVQPGITPEAFRRNLAAYNTRRGNLHKIWPSLMSRSARGKPFTVKGEDARGFEFRERLLVHLAMESLQNEMLEAVHGLLIFAE